MAISDDLDDVRHWAGVIGGRYMGADRADEYGERNGVPGELLVRLTPDQGRQRRRRRRLTTASPAAHSVHSTPRSLRSLRPGSGFPLRR